MITLIALLLALTVLDSPWSWVVVGVAAAIDILETLGLIWWSKRRQPSVGTQTFVGATAEVVDDQWVRVAGELWRARNLDGRHAGERVRVRSVDGLELDVE